MSARFSMILILLVMGMVRTGLSEDAGAETFAPATYGIDRYQHIWKRSPFIVETKTEVVTSPGLASKYMLKAIAWANKSPMVFLLDNSEPDPNKNRFILAQAKPDRIRNLELVSVQLDKDPRKSTALIRQGGEQASLQLDVSMLPPPGPGSSISVGGVIQPSRDYAQPTNAYVPPPPVGQMAPPPSGIVPIAPNPGGAQVPPPTTTRRIIRPQPIHVEN